MTASPSRQRGGALLVIAALLVLGIGWGVMSALSKASVPGRAEREVKTGAALQAAKKALLAYAAQQAARSDSSTPGELPCPESLSSIGTASAGDAASSGCSNVSVTIGRLPWRTLGIDALYDGEGELLWYVLGPGFRNAPINFGSIGQLTYNAAANAAVALIIAPGAALNTLSEPGTPPGGCTAVNQQVSLRNQPPALDAAHFFECGNASGNYAHLGTSQWTNDRVIAVTAAEWTDAIAPAIADRVQREVAPALADWRVTESNTSWGAAFLPAASTFSNPLTNGLCGNYGVREGLMPVARSSSTCTRWTGGTVTHVPALGLVGAVNCAPAGSNYVCGYTQTLSVFGIGSARIRARAPNVGQSFRGRISAASISVNPAHGTVTNFSLILDPATGDALIDFRVEFVLALLSPVTVTIPSLPDAALFADSRMTWFVDNDWARYTYYSIAPGSQLSAPSGCTFAGDTDCMTLNGLPASTGNVNDKRFILALMGPRALSTQVQPSNDADDYIESRTNSMTYHQDRIDTAFNDRVATCPFKHQNHSGADVVICN